MFQPITFLDRNTCPHCLHRIQLIDIDIDVKAIDSDGRILMGENDYKNGNITFLYCPHCKRRYQFDKMGNFVKIKNKDEWVKTTTVYENPLYGGGLGVHITK